MWVGRCGHSSGLRTNQQGAESTQRGGLVKQIFAFAQMFARTLGVVRCVRVLGTITGALT